MNKYNKILNKTWLVLVFYAMLSCRTEDTLISAPVQTQEYRNKSLWEEDEVFIENVKKIYDDNADETRMQSRYGKIDWDYATSMNTFDESYLIAPILKNGKIVAHVEARKVGSRVFFEFTEKDAKTNDYFGTLIFTKPENLRIGENPPANDGSSNISYGTLSLAPRTLECRTVTKTTIIGYIEGGGPNQGGEITETYNETICKFVDGPADRDTCIGIVDEFGNCGGGGGSDGGGYNYPNPEDEENDCSKANETSQNVAVAAKISELNTSSNFSLDHECGFYEKNGEFFPTFSEPCTNYVKAQTSINCLTGILHTHQNNDCSGDPTIKVPSPEDIMIFMQIPVLQAKNCLNDIRKAYSITVTSAGTYMMKYNNTNLPSNTNYDLDTWGAWYDNEYRELRDNNKFTQDNIEKIFSKFLENCVSIAGLEVYKISDNKMEKLTYDPSTDTIIKIECP